MDKTMMNGRDHTGHGWLVEFRQQMTDAGISQTQLAAQLGMTRSYVNRLLNGRATLTEEMQRRLGHALLGLTNRDSMFILVDYVRVRFNTQDAEYVFKKLFPMNRDFFSLTEKAFYGFDYTIQRGDISIMSTRVGGPNAYLGTMIEMHGSGCRQLEAVLVRDGLTWFDFFQACDDLTGIYKRVDFAINDTVGIIDIPHLIQKVEKEELVSLFKSKGAIETIKKGRVGKTVQFGSPQSLVQMIGYQKDIEQYFKNKIDYPEDSPILNRFEVRLRDQRAQKAMKELLACQDAETVVFGIINHYLRVVTPQGSKKLADCPLDPDWQTFIGDNRNRLKLAMRPEPITMDSVLNWLTKQVAPSLKMVQQVDSLNGTDMIADMINEAELSPQQKTLLKEVLEQAQHEDEKKQSNE